MSAKPRHTPGPWHVSELDHATIGPRRIVRIADVDVPQAQAVARVYHRTGETDANARLIAAAPEILTLLERILRDMEDSHGGNDRDMFMLKIRALLARIDGREP